jgi:hypothetical protein
MDVNFHAFLSSLDPVKIVSGGGVSYVASWVVFFVLAPVLRWLGLGWKLASAVAYGISWAAMLAFFGLWIKPSSLSPPSTSNTPTAL